jgi:hypothetical protein
LLVVVLSKFLFVVVHPLLVVTIIAQKEEGFVADCEEIAEFLGKAISLPFRGANDGRNEPVQKVEVHDPAVLSSHLEENFQAEFFHSISGKHFCPSR